MIDDNEVRRKFQQFGDVKSVMPIGDRAEYDAFPFLLPWLFMFISVSDMSNIMTCG